MRRAGYGMRAFIAFYVSSRGHFPLPVVSVVLAANVLSRIPLASHTVNLLTATAMLRGKAGKQMQRTPMK